MAVRSSAAGILAVSLLLASCSSDPAKSARQFVELGQKYYRDKKYPQASILFRRAIQKQPRYGAAYYWLGMTEKERSNRSGAFASFLRAYELQDKDYDAYLPVSDLLLEAYRQERLTNKRLALLITETNDREEKRNPGSKHLPRVRGEILLADRKPVEAVPFLREAVKRDPDGRRAIVPFFNALWASGAKQEAEAFAREALKKHPDFEDIHNLYSDAMRREGRHAAVIEVRREQIQRSPKNLTARLALAEAYVRMGDRAGAEATLKAITDNTADFPSGHFHAGQFYVRWLDIERGIETYREGMRLRPARTEQYMEKIIEATLMMGRYQQVRRMVDELVNRFPDSAHARAIRGSMRLSQDREAGLTDLRAAVAREPENASFRYALGEAARTFGDPKEAEMQLTEAVNRMPESPMPKLSLAVLYLDGKQFGRAFTLAQQVLAERPAHVKARQIRASVWLQMKNLHDARKELELISKLAPNDPDTVLLNASLSLAEGRSKEAEAGYRKLIAAQRSDPRGLKGLLEMYMGQERLKEAQKALAEELTKKPENLDLHIAASEVALRAGDFNEAVRRAQYVAEKTPNSAESWATLGRVQYHQGKLGDAEQSLRKSASLNPDGLAANLHLGTILAQSGRFNEAIPYLDRALKASPDELSALNNLAFILADTGKDVDRALTMAQRAVALSPNDPGVSDTLGWVYLKRKLFKEAAEIFRKNVKAQPANPTWRYHLALALVAAGEGGQARQELQAALKSNPSGRERAEIEQLLARTGS